MLKFIDCFRDGELIASLPLHHLRFGGTSHELPREDDLFSHAKRQLEDAGLATAPLDGVTFAIREV